MHGRLTERRPLLSARRIEGGYNILVSHTTSTTSRRITSFPLDWVCPSTCPSPSSLRTSRTSSTHWAWARSSRFSAASAPTHSKSSPGSSLARLSRASSRAHARSCLSSASVPLQPRLSPTRRLWPTRPRRVRRRRTSSRASSAPFSTRSLAAHREAQHQHQPAALPAGPLQPLVARHLPLRRPAPAAVAAAAAVAATTVLQPKFFFPFCNTLAIMNSARRVAPGVVVAE